MDLYPIVLKIDNAYEAKAKVTLIDKMGKHLHGVIEDSWVRVSGGKVRGKIVFSSQEKGKQEIDANDILDLVPESAKGGI